LRASKNAFQANIARQTYGAQSLHVPNESKTKQSSKEQFARFVAGMQVLHFDATIFVGMCIKPTPWPREDGSARQSLTNSSPSAVVTVPSNHIPRYAFNLIRMRVRSAVHNGFHGNAVLRSLLSAIAAFAWHTEGLPGHSGRVARELTLSRCQTERSVLFHEKYFKKKGQR
jgi:hypothetical protein